MVNAVPVGAFFTSCLASSSAFAKTVLPSRVNSIDDEASITSATSLRPLASNRFRFNCFSKMINAVALMRSSNDIPRRISRVR